LEKYRKKNRLSSRAKINFVFDGDKIDFDETPSKYELENEDMIDVELWAR